MIEIIPNWHPILVHFTFALLAIATLLFVVRAVTGRDRAPAGLETAANWNLWLGAAVTALTVAAGLNAAGTVAHDDAAHAAMENHKYWGVGTAALFMLLAVWNGWRVRVGRGVGIAFVAVMIVAAVGLVGTGLRGADLVFRHGLGVMALPAQAGAEHSHEDGAEHSHDEAATEEAGEHSHEPPAATADAATPVPEITLSPAEAEVVAALNAYHEALTQGDAAAVEGYVLPDDRFVMFEGKHTNFGWADYRDNHLKGELADLSKVRFRLSGYRVQLDGGLAYVSFIFNVLPKTGPEMDFGKGRATAVLVATGSGWKVRHLHTS
jgi:uncharacterized membrane protein/ketosteroid isomerase-like protein